MLQKQPAFSLNGICEDRVKNGGCHHANAHQQCGLRKKRMVTSCVISSAQHRHFNTNNFSLLFNGPLHKLQRNVRWHFHISCLVLLSFLWVARPICLSERMYVLCSTNLEEINTINNWMAFTCNVMTQEWKCVYNGSMQKKKKKWKNIISMY